MKIVFLLGFICISFLHVQLCADKNILYIGTGGKNAKGIYKTVFNHTNGKFSEVKLAAEISSPNFLTLHPSKSLLFAVAKWEKAAGVIGYKILEDGSLNEFTRQSCPDGMGCHLTIHPTGNFLVTAQYGRGSVALFPLDSNGQLSEPIIFEHTGGSGVSGNRQNSPHPHWCGFSPCGKFLMVPDLGMDQILVYQVDTEMRNISIHGFARARAGGGPRHMKFSADGKFIFLLNELSMSVESFAWDAETGKAKAFLEIPTLSEEEKAGETFNSAAEILVHPSGNWVYSSNRGHDSVSAFKHTGKGYLELIQKQSVRGAFPRNINFSPNAEWLIAAGQESNSIAAHKINPKNGRLTDQRGALTIVPNPTCLLFLKNL
jgi:6-phosphogluconolactonase